MSDLNTQAKGWDRRTLGSLAKYINGRAFKPEDWKTSGLPIVRIEQINNPNAQYDYYDGFVEERHLIDSGDLLFSWSATLTALIWERGPGVLNQHIFKVVASEDTEHRFLHHLLNFLMNELAGQTHGSTMKHIKRSDLLPFTVGCPPLPEQRRIAAVLDALDETIAATEALVAKLTLMRQGLLHDLLTRGLDEHGELRDPERHPEQFRESEVGLVPMGWEVGPLRRLISFIDAGKSPECPDIPASSGQWGVLKVSAVRPEGFRAEENKVIVNDAFKNPDYEVKDGDLLITRANTYELVGLSCLVINPPSNLLLCDKTLRLHIKIGLASKKFVFMALQMPYIRAQIEINATGSSGSMKNIGQETIKNLIIALPLLEEQNRIVLAVEAHDARLRSEEAYLAKLRQMKRGLMDDLLTGRVRVPEGL